jgi:hypothetical protein
MSTTFEGNAVVAAAVDSGIGEVTARLLGAEGARRGTRLRRWMTSLAAAIATPMPIRSPTQSSLERRESEDGSALNIKSVLFGIATALPHM